MLTRIKESARARRRLLWVVAAVAVGGAGALVFVLVPNRGGGIASTRTGTVQRVPRIRQVPVTPERRAAIDTLFDHFVPLALARRDPVAARAYVTPNLRSQATLADWRAGSIPVPPFQPRGTTFHGWRTVYSYPAVVNVELTLEPRRRGDEVTSFSIDVKRVGGRWLVDSVYQLGTHGGAPAASAARPSAPARSNTVSSVDQGLKARLGLVWILVPAGFLSLIVLVPAAVFIRDWLAYRRVDRRDRRKRKELPPLPKQRRT